jgi:hypothetical protein
MCGKLPGEGAIGPLSFAQEGCWLLSRLLPTDSSYNIRSCLRLRGPLDVVALRRALAELVARHQILRTTYHECGAGVPVQLVGPLPANLPEEVDLRDVPAADREAAALRAARAEAARPIDLSAGPVYRVVLLRLAPAEHWLLDICHHVAVDWLSALVANGELRALYSAFAAGRGSPLPALRLQYRHYAAREREHVDDPRIGAGLAYWRAKLSGAPAGPALSPGYRHPAAGGLEVANLRLPLPAESMERLIALARAERATPFAATLACWAATLFRHTGQDDVVMVSDVSTRANRHLQALVGLLVNAIALRVQVSGYATFRQLVARVRRTVAESIVHGVPFQRIVEESGLGREWGWEWNQLRHLGFVMHPYGPQASRPSAPDWPLRADVVEIANDQSHLELNLHLTSTPGGWWADLTHRRRTTSAEAASRVGRGFVTLLESASRSPDEPVARLACGA